PAAPHSASATPAPTSEPAPPTSEPAAAPHPGPAPVPVPVDRPAGRVAPVLRQGSVLPMILIGLGVLFFLWLLSRAFRRPQQPTYGAPPQQPYGGQPQPVGPAPGYGPASAPRPSGPPVAN